jgi:hypothetical protein
MYVFLDRFFLVFHTALIAFNLFGWLWKKTRTANLLVLLGTLLSWTVLGIWRGFGYCPFTEWHWRVRLALGDTDLPASYIAFLVDTLTGLQVRAELVDALAVLLLGMALAASLAANARDYLQKRRGG